MLKTALRRKIIFLFLFFGLLPLAITFFLSIVNIQRSLKETVNNSFASLSNEVMSSVEKTARDVYSNIELLATNPLIRSKEVSKEEKLSEIQKVQDFYGIFDDITLIDLDGNVIISTTYQYRGDWKNKEWYQNAKQGKSSISPAHIILGPYKVILSSSAPVRDNKGNIIAVIAGQVNMERIWEITNDIRVGETGFAFILNREGGFVFHPEKEKILTSASYKAFLGEIFSKNNGTISYFDEKNEKMIGSFSSFSEPKLAEQLGWRLVITQPEKEAFALVKTLQKQIILVFLGGSSLLFLISYLLGAGIVVPLKKLIQATREISFGKFEESINIKTGDEIEELAGSFNKMAIDLKKSKDVLEESKGVLEVKVSARTRELKELANSLEKKVRERTKELQSRLDELEKFRRLTVGRELKMIELKKKIKEGQKACEINLKDC